LFVGKHTLGSFPMENQHKNQHMLIWAY